MGGCGCEGGCCEDVACDDVVCEVERGSWRWGYEVVGCGGGDVVGCGGGCVSVSNTPLVGWAVERPRVVRKWSSGSEGIHAWGTHREKPEGSQVPRLCTQEYLQ